MKFQLTIAAAALALVPSAAFAEEDAETTGAYIGVHVGLASMSDANIQYYDAGGTFGGTGATDTADGTIDLKNAVTFGGVLGYDFGSVRADVEIDYAKHSINSLTVNALNGTAVTLTPTDRSDICTYLDATVCGGSGNTFVITGSRARTLTAMGNLWVDLPMGGVTPYVGGGLGITGFEVDGEGKGKFAWQLGAGVGFKLGDKMVLSLDFRHREVGATQVEFDGSSGYRIGKLKSNTLSAGLRVVF